MIVEKTKRLKDETGIPLFEARQTLEKAEGDYEKALELIYEEGMRIARQRKAKLTKASSIGYYVHGKQRMVSIVELCCESDLTASAEFFLRFANDIAKHISASECKYLNEKEVDIEEIKNLNEEEKGEYYEKYCLLNQKYILNPKITIDELLMEFIYTHKENVEIKRFETYEARRDL